MIKDRRRKLKLIQKKDEAVQCTINNECDGPNK